MGFLSRFKRKARDIEDPNELAGEEQEDSENRIVEDKIESPIPQDKETFSTEIPKLFGNLPSNKHLRNS